MADSLHVSAALRHRHANDRVHPREPCVQFLKSADLRRGMFCETADHLYSKRMNADEVVAARQRQCSGIVIPLASFPEQGRMVGGVSFMRTKRSLCD